MRDKVKCADCGFLAVRLARTWELVEAEQWMRERGAWKHQINNLDVYDGDGKCFAREFDLSSEAFDLVAQTLPVNESVIKSAWQQVLERDRNCPKFTEWRQGFTPKEHQEMIDRQWMLEQQSKRDADERDWKERESDRSRKSANRSLAVAVISAFAAVSGLVVNAWTKSQPPPAARVELVLPPSAPAYPEPHP